MRNSQHKQFKLRTFAPILKSGKFEIGNIEYQFSSAFSAKILKTCGLLEVQGSWIEKAVGARPTNLFSTNQMHWNLFDETETPTEEDGRATAYVSFLLTVSSILMHMQSASTLTDKTPSFTLAYFVLVLVVVESCTYAQFLDLDLIFSWSWSWACSWSSHKACTCFTFTLVVQTNLLHL